jgi:uncharacterized protein
MRNRYDCSKCPGYCCSYDRISVSEADVRRLARHFGIDADVARQRYTWHYRAGDTDEWILRHRKDTIFKSVCRFLDQETRRCTVYHARPNVCRRYPYGVRCGYFEFLEFEREQQDDPDFIPSA